MNLLHSEGMPKATFCPSIKISTSEERFIPPCGGEKLARLFSHGIVAVAARDRFSIMKAYTVLRKELTMQFTEEHITSILKAFKFTAEKHRDQRRKDAESTPYVNHPIEVAELLWRIGRVRDIKTIIAALLHDVLEDTMTEPREIRDLFGAEVLSLVLEVTDDKKLPKLERKKLQIVHAPGLSLPAKLVKIADKICNVRDVTHSPPREWSNERRMEYLLWTEKVVKGLRGSNEALEAVYDETLREGLERLNIVV